MLLPDAYLGHTLIRHHQPETTRHEPKMKPKTKQ